MADLFSQSPNEASFSSLIDSVILATGRPASLPAIVQAANLTIRECQALGLFAEDLVEDGVPVTTTTGTTQWARPPYFRSLRAVRYMCDTIGGGSRQPFDVPLRLPGRAQRNECRYYYAASDYFIFQGAGYGETIALAIYFWQKPLIYYAASGVNSRVLPGGPYDTRLAYLKVDTNTWMYLLPDGTYATTTGNVDTDAAYRALSSNWLVQDWVDLISAGTRAKIFATAGDQRAVVDYALYKQMQRTLQLTHAYEGEGY